MCLGKLRLQSRFAGACGKVKSREALAMPLLSTKLCFFLVGKEIGRTNKDCDVPIGLKAILLLKERML